MGLTNFPHGISSFGIPVIGSGYQIPPTTGSYFFVDSNTGLSSNPGTMEEPLATIAQAVAKCTAAKSDVIVVFPRHAETLTAASQLVFNISDVTVVGLGNGLARPTITFGTVATTTIGVSAANVTVKNIIFSSAIDDCAAAFTVAAAKDFAVIGCDFLDSATDKNFLSIVVTGSTNNAADGLTFVGNRRYDNDAAGLATISILGNLDRLTVTDNYAECISTADVGHFIIMSSKVCKGARIERNELMCMGDISSQSVGIFMTGSSTTSTGIVAYNLVNSLDVTTPLLDTAGLDFGHFENYITTAGLAKSGTLLPAGS